MEQIRSWLIYTLQCFMGIATLVLTVVTTLQVIARYIFSNPIAWGQDIIRLSFIYLVFLGAALCVDKVEHLNIDVCLEMLSDQYRKVISLGIDVVLIIFYLFLLIYGYDFTVAGMNQLAPYLPIPMSIYYAAVPLSALFMAYFQFAHIVRTVKKGGDE